MSLVVWNGAIITGVKGRRRDEHLLGRLFVEVVYDSKSHGVSQDVADSPQPVKEPVYAEQESNDVERKVDSSENHHHSDESCLRNASSTNGGKSGGDDDDNHLSDRKLHSQRLGSKDGSHSLVESSAVHVDGGAERKNEPGVFGRAVVVFLAVFHGDGESGRGRGSSEGKQDGREKVEHVPVGVLASEEEEDERENEHRVDKKSHHHRHHKHPHLAQLLPEVPVSSQFGDDERHDSEWSEPESQIHNVHDRLIERLKEAHHRCCLLSHFGQSDSQKDGKDYQSKNV